MAFFVINVSASAADPTTLKPSSNLYVTDTTGTLSQSTIDEIVNKNLEWRQTETKPEVAVVIIDSVGDYGDVDTFADYLVRQPEWSIGNREHDNGVLILFALNNGANNMRISTGYGVEGVLPDISTYRIMQDNLSLIKSNKKQNIDQGILNIFNDVSIQVDLVAGNISEIDPAGDGSGIDLFWIILFIILIFIFRYTNGGGYNGVSTSGVWVGSIFNDSSSSGGGFGGGGSFGGGSFGGGGSSV